MPVPALAPAAAAPDVNNVITISDEEEADIDPAHISDGKNTSLDTLHFSEDEGAGNEEVAVSDAMPVS